MLCAGQLELAADPVVAQRDTLLDAREMAPRILRLLCTQGPIPVEDCRIAACRYRFGESLRVLYRVAFAGSTRWFSARTFAAGRGEEICGRAIEKVRPSHSFLPCVYDEGLQTLFCSFPNDRKLRSLSHLADPHRQFRRSIHPRWEQTLPVAYSPESRATFRCTSAAGTPLAYLKAYRPDEARRIGRIYSAAAESIRDAHLQPFTPQLGAASQEYGALFLAPVHGATLSGLCGSDLLHGIGRLGRTLALLHSLPAPSQLPRFTRHASQRIASAAAMIGNIRPELSEAAASLAAALSLGSAPAAAAVFLHGDVHLKNAVRGANRLYLVDLDQAAVGPAAADLGSCLALLRYQRHLGASAHEFERELGARFLAEYAAVRALPDPDALRWHAAAALLVERALRSVTRLRPQGLACLDVLLADATQILRGNEFDA